MASPETCWRPSSGEGHGPLAPPLNPPMRGRGIFGVARLCLSVAWCGCVWAVQKSWLLVSDGSRRY